MQARKVHSSSAWGPAEHIAALAEEAFAADCHKEERGCRIDIHWKHG
jgi:hypothetical protein